MPGPRREIAETQCLAGLPPGPAGDAAFRLFCTPALSERRPPDYAALAYRARYHLSRARWLTVPTAFGALQTYVFDPDAAPPLGTVLVVHGWTSEASFMSALAEPIRRAGFRVVLFDMPAHGLSPGRVTNLIDCAKATQAVGEAVGPVEAIVGHSFGGLAGLLAMEGARPIDRPLGVARVVLVACPNRLTDVTDEFCARRGVSDAGRRTFERRLERVGWRSIKGISAAALLATTGRPALVVHARDDAQVPFARAEEIVAEVPAARLAAFDNLGHSAILFASPSVRGIAKFLKDGVAAA